MAQGVTPDGIAVHARVETKTDRNLHRKVIDLILNSTTFGTRFLGMGRKFTGTTMDATVKVTNSGLFEWFSGLESLSTQASSNEITMSFAHTAGAQPIVLPLLESMANVGPQQRIDLDVYKYEEAIAEAVEAVGEAVFGTGSGDQILGLEALVDNGTNAATIGGQTRSSYDPLDATVTASGGTLTLAKLATLYSAVSAGSLGNETPSINVTTETVWDLYEQLLAPTVRSSYTDAGYNALPLRAKATVKSQALLGGHAGFTALTYKGVPVIKDEFCTSGVWYALNERYLFFAGRSIVPPKFAPFLERITLGRPKTIEGTAAENLPPKGYGWFIQKAQMMPSQAGIIGRVYLVGQGIVTSPRRQGKLTGITGV